MDTFDYFYWGLVLIITTLLAKYFFNLELTVFGVGVGFVGVGFIKKIFLKIKGE